jgi:antibiotic biosynthesis monooxygenase (ABM) superfamily enzyme
VDETPTAATAERGPEPVTVVISRLVRPGMEQAYEDWIHEAALLLQDLPGADGITVLPPGAQHSGPEYVLVLRFHDYAAMAAWKRSPERARWIARLPDLTVDPGEWQEQSGLETWFTVPGRVLPTGPPPRWKQAALTVVGLVPLLLLFDVLLRPVLGTLPALVRIPLTTPLVVVAMAWLVMPALTRLTYPWLYPGQR